MKLPKISLLARALIAIILGIACGMFFPPDLARVFTTFNGLFGNFLGFIVPILILGLIAPAIADLGKSAGKILLLTIALAYAFTLFAGFFAYSATLVFIKPMLNGVNNFAAGAEGGINLAPFFTVAMPPLMDVMTALMLGFIIGLGSAITDGKMLKAAMKDLEAVVNFVISKAIVPLLPLYIFGIFLEMTLSGQAAAAMGVFVKITIVIFLITVVMLLIQFSIAGLVARRNPLSLLKTMLPAYATALGTQSSAATIPVTLRQTIKAGVSEEVANFVIPLCATIQMTGSIIKVVACSMVIMIVGGMPFSPAAYSGFILMLSITIIAAPGIPGGVVMAALGILHSMLGFDETALGLMIALYVAMDSFGTACNVTGDGAVAVIVDKFHKTAEAK
ncbi:MAG: dicarboxylate/amino acid:cation symporter [Endomicrobia bacterium]|nr:dicarboxylate/amino acid:cation symporter [Endomicrobiia bacterium]